MVHFCDSPKNKPHLSRVPGFIVMFIVFNYQKPAGSRIPLVEPLVLKYRYVYCFQLPGFYQMAKIKRNRPHLMIGSWNLLYACILYTLIKKLYSRHRGCWRYDARSMGASSLFIVAHYLWWRPRIFHCRASRNNPDNPYHRAHTNHIHFFISRFCVRHICAILSGWKNWTLVSQPAHTANARKDPQLRNLVKVKKQPSMEDDKVLLALGSVEAVDPGSPSRR
jgi:hypothetical protein